MAVHVSHGDSDNGIIGINWGSSNFRAWLIATDGTAIDELSIPRGVAGLDRAGMAAVADEVAARWPGNAAVYACGMIGSNIGWTDVPYALAPAGLAELVAAATPCSIGTLKLAIVPGIACRRQFDAQPDILRGEEIELMGLAAIIAGHNGLVALPGTHTKWVWFQNGRIIDFFTSMSGEIYDRLTGAGLLASIVEGEAADGQVFLAGVAMGRSHKLGLGTLLFGARASVIRGDLARSDAASWIRGLLIGSEIADVTAMYGDLARQNIPLVGNAALSRLYSSALETVDVAATIVDSRTCGIAGFRALDLVHRSA